MWKMLAKALELDPNLAEAHAVKGLALKEEYDLKQAEAELKKAIELKPSHATSHFWYSLVLTSELRWSEAQSQIEKAVELDPLSPTISLHHASFYFAKRDFPRVIELAERAAELGAISAHGTMAFAYYEMGMKDEMRREWAVITEWARGEYPDSKIVSDMHAARFEGDTQKLEKLLSEVISQFETLNRAQTRGAIVSAYGVACICFHLGKVDLGFEWLERSYSERDLSLLDMQWDWDLDGVRTDPRYLDLVKRLGLD